MSRQSLSLIFISILLALPISGLWAKDSILLVVTNHSELGDTGKETGYFLSEVAHPWKVFRDAGYEVVFGSPEGGFAPMDPKSFDLEDSVNLEFWQNLDAVEGLATTLSLEEVDPDEFAAVFFAGGHGAMWDFPEDSDLQETAVSIYESGGAVGAVCHGPAALVNIQLSDGSYLVEGKKVGGFTNSEEEAVGLTDTVPFLLESRLEERGGDFVAGADFQEQVVTDERLVTGQNPASAEAAAEAIVKILQGSK
ncbi:type 1 glutamine amidotransferase domain-containing protein [Puniceicoccus vermicola]|uniref:Type 1 glutamine amidotransferase domain-containing protein n=1 Tax=Puniceicoccus vermicola TaxID=388746 RepID=A0A7X1B1R0_9BACT|nr:type 1 glutamine amidotransferase domain-containing protein [Puniceicoccus vermicola]